MAKAIAHHLRPEDYSRIVAPYDGVVTWRFADTGALMQAGTYNIGVSRSSAGAGERLRLRIPVPDHGRKCASAISADIHVQATGEHFTGKVTRFTGAFDTSTRTMQVEIDVPNPDYHLQPGMYADVKLSANSRADVLTVPVEAIQRSENKTSVLVVDPQNRVQSRQVQVGIESSNNVEILAGLTEASG